ncbi:MAG: nuclear transport factor 2 family protein [Bacteroidota bacterium]
MKILTYSLLIICTMSQVIAQNVTETHKDSLNNMVQKYYDLNLNVFQENSTIQDIDKVFELFTDDFVYIHPKYGGTYTREDLYNGYVRNQKNGGYKGEETGVKIINKIIGLKAIVVQRSYVLKKDGLITDGEPQMTLFEFQDGKISRIVEYW